MSLKVGVVMDPIESIHLETDSTLVMMQEACKRGHELFCMQSTDLAAEGCRLFGRVTRLRVHETTDPFEILSEDRMELNQLDVLLVRKDPPFDDAYLYLTQLLDLLQGEVWVMNSPQGLRLANEKIFALNFSDFIPATLVTSKLEEVIRFRKACQGRVVLKPLDLFGGEGIEFVDSEKKSLSPIVERLTKAGRVPLMAQEFLPDVKKGDKRITLINGHPEGAILRVPKEGELKANLHSGGSAVATVLTDRDHQICEALGERLRTEGLFLVGIDIIGDYLTEINVTSPTCFQETRKLSGISLQSKVLDFMEQEL